MEEQTQIKELEVGNTATEKHPVFQVTTLSKYVALALFVALPFLGGYVGYQMAPEKIDEIEKVIEVPAERQKELVSTDTDMMSVTNNRYNWENFDSKTDTLEIAGLALASVDRSEKVTRVSFYNAKNPTDFGEPGKNVSGHFDIAYNFHGGSYQITFYPDEATKTILPWPHSRNEEPNRYWVLVSDVLSFAPQCDVLCQSAMKDIDQQLVLKSAGQGQVTRIVQEVENIGVGSAGDIIEIENLVLQFLP